MATLESTFIGYAITLLDTPHWDILLSLIVDFSFEIMDQELYIYLALGVEINLDMMMYTEA